LLQTGIRTWESLGFLIEGLSFLRSFVQKPVKLPIRSEEQALRSVHFKDKEYRTKVFYPSYYHPRKTKAILLTHGMSVLGIDDPRIIDLAENLCLAGYLVFLPELIEVKALQITPETAEHILDLSLVVSKIRDMYRQDSLGIFCISFTGGMGLNSLSRREVEGAIQSILSLGAYSDFSVLIKHSSENFEYDNYPFFILMYNFIESFVSKSDDLKRIFWESALDNALYRQGENSIALKIKKNLSLKDREIYDLICTNPSYRNSIVDQICLDLSNLIRVSSPIHNIENIFAPISLIHGKNDRVIPESESINIGNVLKKKGKPYNLEVTGLLSHGDTIPIWKRAGDVPGLAKAFGFFLRNI
jgi:hypothetical protein